MTDDEIMNRVRGATKKLAEPEMLQIEAKQRLIITLSEGEDYYEERANLMRQGKHSSISLNIEFAGLVDPKVLLNSRSVFYGPDFPYLMAWVAVAKEDGRTAEAQRNHQEVMMMSGYRPCNLNTLQESFVVGRDAALLAIDRSLVMMQHYRKHGLAVPELPKSSKDKFGMVLPPIVDQKGYLSIVNMQLWYVERESVDAVYAAGRARMDNWQKTGEGIDKIDDGGTRRETVIANIPDLQSILLGK